MSRKLISMEQIKQILQLYNDGIGIREIARLTGLSRNSIKKYLGRLNLQTCKDEAVSDNQLAKRAYENDSLILDAQRRLNLLKHFEYAQKELGKTGVTRQLLWIEYKEQYSDGYNYSQYCHHFKAHLKQSDVIMHLDYQAGDMIMIDFAGKKLSYVDKVTGEVIECEVFISILPHSGPIFCKAVHSQKTGDFVNCVNAMLKFYSGVSRTILCDNLKTAVIRPCKYEPLFTDVCYQLGEHYQTTFSATRPYSPRDKAMVESAVRIVYTNVYAVLRNHEHHSLEELNHAIKTRLQDLNHKSYKKTAYSRWDLFQQNELQLLKPLPSEPFVIKKVDIATVQRNYHIQLKEDKLYYSVPYSYVGKKVRVLYDERTLEVYYDHNRIALHMRTRAVKGWSTIEEHMPPNHQHMHKVKGFTKEDLLSQAARIGEYTHHAVVHMLDNSIYIEQNYKACYGMIMLSKKYTPKRLEDACRRAASGTRINYTMIKNILAHGLDKQPLLFDNNPIPDHENIRGAQNYT